jgi:hypothetical protein
MMEVFKGMAHEHVLKWIDDIMVFGRRFED